MKLFLKNNKAVSQLVGYLLTLMITASVVSVSLIATNSAINDKTSNAATLFAENLASRVSDAIVNVCIMKDQYPESDYSISVDIPNKLADRYDYYIELSNKQVYVNSTTGDISVSQTTFNAPNNVKMDISGRVYGSQQSLKLSCEKSNYTYRFDFGTDSSDVLEGYNKVTENCDSSSVTWEEDCLDWKYVSKIKITNPLGYNPGSFSILIQLNENNFGHYLANNDGSDLRFYDSKGNELYYWIERWYYPGETYTSRVWVKLNELASGTDSYIYMYYGNEDASFDDHHSGKDTFLFFDDFNGEDYDIDTNWTQSKSDSNDKIYVENGILYLENSSAVTAKSFSRAGSDPYIIDVKAKAGGSENGSEASMFARYSSSNVPPYKYSYVFSSNSFDYDSNSSEISDLAKHSSDIIKWISSSPPWNDVNLADLHDDEPVTQGWNRLRFIVNKNDSIGVRYLYNSFTVEGYGSASGCGDSTLDSFGLCTLVSDSKAVGQYDWVFVHKFVSNTSSSGDREDVEPFAYVEDTYSRNFKWKDVSGSLVSSEDANGKDFISMKNGEATFLITNLTETTDDMKYSLTFTLGNKSCNVDDLEIEITDRDGGSPKTTIYVNDFTNYSSVWVSNIKVKKGADGIGDLEIRFQDTGAGDDYWSVDEITLELSDRIIKAEGG